MKSRESLHVTLQELRSAVANNPECAGHHLALGNTYAALHRLDEAIQSYETCLRINPKLEIAHYNLGTIYRSLGRYDEAISSFQFAIQLNSFYVDAFMNLGLILHELGESIDGETCLKHAVQLDSNNPNLLFNLARIYDEQNKLDQAIHFYCKAIDVDPKFVSPYYNLGSIYKKMGDIQNAMMCYDYVLRLDPDHHRAFSNHLLCLNYLSGWAPLDISQAHRTWWALYGRIPDEPPSRLAPEDDAQRPLHVGYLSPDLRAHSVSYFFEALLRHHNASAVTSFCYADVPRPDATSERLESLCDQWVNVHGWSNEALAGRIRTDRIDILVDLAGHTGRNRMPLFARRAAPIQVSYLGYPNTTGLAAMDFRITDGISDPPGRTGHLYTERLVRIPGGFLCYTPPPDAPPVAPPPHETNGWITFGSFNNRAKITGEVLDVWSAILRQVPGARLVLKFKGLDSRLVRDPLVEEFRARGLDPNRIWFRDACPALWEHLDCYRHVDLALDPFPYNGTTTTLEALWMGVPVITHVGTTHVSRVGASILEAVGLQHLAARSREAYTDLAVRLAESPAELSSMRGALRPRLEASPLMDGAGFTRRLERAYQWMWNQQGMEGAGLAEDNGGPKPDLNERVRQGEETFALGDASRAASIFLEVLEQAPHHVEALNNLGVVLWQQRRWAAAHACFRKVQRLNPGHEESRDNLEHITCVMEGP